MNSLWETREDNVLEAEKRNEEELVGGLPGFGRRDNSAGLVERTSANKRKNILLQKNFVGNHAFRKMEDSI